MKILIVEDDKAMAETVRKSLTACSHAVDVSADGADGSFLARSYAYDAIVLDYALPKKSGLEVCREIRTAGKTTPIVFMSVTDDVETKIAAFRQGADDYVTKPFSLDELRARLEAVSRRSPDMQSAILTVGDITLDSDANSVIRAGSPITLTRKEFHMLQYFMQNKGRILSRVQLMEHVWTADSNPFSNTVEAHLRNLKMKINIGGAQNMIINIPGRGYIMDAPEALALRKRI